VLWVAQPSKSFLQRVQTRVRRFCCAFKSAASWRTICLPRSQGGLGVIDVPTQILAFQLKHLRNMVSPDPSLGRSILLSLLRTYSELPNPLSGIIALLQPATRRSVNRIESLQSILKAAHRLPRISVNDPVDPYALPPSETFLATPLYWWIQPLPPPRDCTLYMVGEVFRYDPQTRQISIRSSPTVRRLVRRNTFTMEARVYAATFHPWMEAGDDTAQRILDLPLHHPSTTPPRKKITLETATSKNLRAFFQTPASTVERHGSSADWKRFWRAKIPHSARTIW